MFKVEIYFTSGAVLTYFAKQKSVCEDYVKTFEIRRDFLGALHNPATKEEVQRRASAFNNFASYVDDNPPVGIDTLPLVEKANGIYQRLREMAQ